jgi:hypothetical protein
MSFFNGMDADERAGLYELINALLEKLDVQRRLNEDLTRKLDSVNARLELLTLAHYGTL